MSVVVDQDLVESPREWVAPSDLEPDRKFWRVHFDEVTYVIVARDESHVRDMLPEIVAQISEPPYQELLSEYGDPQIREVDGGLLIGDDDRDGKQHRIDTYPMGMWACSEY